MGWCLEVTDLSIMLPANNVYPGPAPAGGYEDNLH